MECAIGDKPATGEVIEDRDLIIVGGGPAGLTAGLYAARARLDTLLVERLSPGGQVLNTDWVENWPGDPEGVSGFDLADRMRDHALKFGLEIKSMEVTSLADEGDRKVLATHNGLLKAKSIILALGANPRKLGIPGEEKLMGRGVSYCATCDGAFYRDQVVACIGGGDTAAEEAVFLTRFASKVYMIHRRDALRASAVLAERVTSNEKIEMLWSHAPLEVLGEDGVTGLKIKDLKTGEERELPVDGAFIFVGTSPQTGFCTGTLDLDEQGFILTDKYMQTNLPGVFAAGDARKKMLRQIVTAAGDGATAAYAAQLYLEDHS